MKRAVTHTHIIYCGYHWQRPVLGFKSCCEPISLLPPIHTIQRLRNCRRTLPYRYVCILNYWSNFVVPYIQMYTTKWFNCILILPDFTDLMVTKIIGVRINEVINNSNQMRAVNGKKNLQPVSQAPSLVVCLVSFKQLQLWKVKSCQKKKDYTHETTSKSLYNAY